MNIRKPTKEYIMRVVRRNWDTYFSDTDPALSKVFKAFPKNKEFSEVLIKVVLLDRLYHVNIFKPYAVARHIVHLSVDKALSEGTIDIVGKIARVKIGSQSKYFYSFATKYCNWHSPNKFFIYDSFVDYILREYKRKFHFMEFSPEDLREYERYHRILLNFMDFFHLDSISKKTLDEFLWLEGKRIKKEL